MLLPSPVPLVAIPEVSGISASPVGLRPSTDLVVRRDRSQVWVVATALVALAIKLVIALNTFGTNDVIAFYQFASSLTEHGLRWCYENLVAFNHPPLVAYSLEGILRLSHEPFLERNGISFPFLLRLPGIIADFITVLILLRVNQQTQLKIAPWALHLFALSPVSLMVSGFHGNTDPIMVLFLVLASYMVLRNKPIASGIFFALSCQIKIIPLLFFPIFFLFWYAHRGHARFFLSTTTASLLLWSGPLLNFPVTFIKNVLSYGSFWGLWGITYWLRLTGWSQFGRVTFHDFLPAQNLVANLLKLLIIVAVLVIACRRRTLAAESFFQSIAYAWIIFFVFSPGVCAQYMVWLAPFIVLLSPMLYGYLTMTSALFLFFFYNTIADAFPWYIGISQGSHNEKWLPWSIWPWTVLIIGMVVLWRKAVKKPSLQLLSFQEAGSEVN